MALNTHLNGLRGHPLAGEIAVDAFRLLDEGIAPGGVLQKVPQVPAASGSPP
jgi:hypothetical protein